MFIIGCPVVIIGEPITLMLIYWQLDHRSIERQFFLEKKK